MYRALYLAATLLVAPTAVLAADLEFRKVTLNEDSLFSAAAAFDVDHDGDLDIIGGGLWYEAPDWTPHKIRDVEIIRGMPDGFAAQPYDVNHDGWMDFIEVNYRSASIRWIEHPGAALGEWTAHTVIEPGPMETGRLADVDGDGAPDLLVNGARWAAWWELIPRTRPDGSKTTEFVRRDLPEALAGHGFAFGDVNGDGRDDIVSSDGWAEAPEDRIVGEWTWHGEFELGRVSAPFQVQDVDGDGDADLVYSIGHGFGLFWEEQVQQGGRRAWKHHEIDTTWSQAHFILWEDLDGDGRPEAVVGKRYMAHGGRDPGAEEPLGIYSYQFEPASKTWVKRVLSYDDGVGFGLDAKAVDIDDDGDIDLVCPGRSGLYLLENRRK